MGRRLLLPGGGGGRGRRRSLPCWPAIPSATPASTTRGPSPAAVGAGEAGASDPAPPWSPGPPTGHYSRVSRAALARSLATRPATGQTEPIAHRSWQEPPSENRSRARQPDASALCGIPRSAYAPCGRPPPGHAGYWLRGRHEGTRAPRTAIPAPPRFPACGRARRPSSNLCRGRERLSRTPFLWCPEASKMCRPCNRHGD